MQGHARERIKKGKNGQGQRKGEGAVWTLVGVKWAESKHSLVAGRHHSVGQYRAAARGTQ